MEHLEEKKQQPPEHLTKAAKVLWSKLCDEYDLADTASRILLETALSSFDEWQGARTILAKEGHIVKDRFGQRVVHPAARLARDSKATMISALRQLHLDLEPLRDLPGRPPGRR